MANERSPTLAWRVEALALAARSPRHLLLLCVANSARSQMAEGLARSLARPGVTVSSAGSSPTGVRPEAVQVLAELGIDISGQRSKGFEAVDRASVDTVITLCADEVCPAFFGRAHRVHWALPDPAQVNGDLGERLEAFRRVRDELLKRLTVVLGAPP